MCIHRPLHDISCEGNRAKRHVNLGMTRKCLTNLSIFESENGYVIFETGFFLLFPAKQGHQHFNNILIIGTVLLKKDTLTFLDVEKRFIKNGLCELNVFPHVCQIVIIKWWVNHSLWIVCVFCSGFCFVLFVLSIVFIWIVKRIRFYWFG